MGECGVSCMKYLVFLFNLLFAITGLAILTIGAFIQTSYYHYANFVGESFWTAPILLMIVGAVVFVIAFLGCCGAVKENSCMVLTFSILIVAIFLCEIGIGIAGYIKHSEIDDILEKGFNKTMNDYVHNQDAWKLVQTELNCCGINGPDDWQKIFHNSTLPRACCSELPVDQNICTKEWSHPDGCMPKLIALFESKSLLLAGAGIGIALIQLFGIIFACCLYRAFRRNYETV